MQVVMVGTGYVGLVSGTCLAEVGHNVICVDTDERKIQLLKDGKPPIYEPGLEELIRRNVHHERLQFTTELKAALPKAEIVFIAVGTPEGEDGSADLKYVKAVAQNIGEHMTGNLVVVVKSTVPVGTCDLVDGIINGALKKRGVNFRAVIASNPEFLKEGVAVNDFMKPDRIVVGLNNGEGEKTLKNLYAPFITDDPSKLLIMDRRSSELTKYGANAMLATRISFMNELSRLCEKLGANVDNIRRGMGMDERIGRKFLYAGPGYGGSCFPKDVAALLRSGEQYGVQFAVLKAVSDANHAQKNHVAEKIKRHFGDLNGKRIALWGLSFKPGTDDVRESPALTIAACLEQWGAEVVAHDPVGAPNFKKAIGNGTKINYAKSAYEALHGADAVVLITEWSEYKRPNWEKAGTLMRQKVVFDFRNQYDGVALVEAGFHYQCVGRPDSMTKV